MIQIYILLFYIVFHRKPVLDIISETALSCHTDERRYEERTVEGAIELT